MDILDTSSIRQATKEDAADLAKLIDIAGEGISSWLWAQKCRDNQAPLDIGTERARREEGGFSYSNALIAGRHGDVHGMVLSYAIDEAPDGHPNDLPAPIAPFVTLEKRSVGTWYINALAVYAGCRGRGVGTKLLAAAEDRAVSHGSKATSIQVFSQNTAAVRLYLKLGYEVIARSPVRLHPCQPYYTGDVLLLIKAVGR